MKKLLMLAVVVLFGMSASAQDTKSVESTKVVKEKVEKVVNGVEKKAVSTDVKVDVEKVEAEPAMKATEEVKEVSEKAMKEKAKSEDPVEEEEDDDDN